MENILTNDENNELRYAVRVNGQFVGPKCSTPQQAEAQIALLSEAHQSIAEIVPVTAGGGELLLG